MADYNIYIRTIGGGESSSPTTPTQLGGGDGGDAAATASQFISKAGAFASNPDSAIGAAGSTAVGAISKAAPWVGVVILAASILIKLTDSIYSKYTSFASSASGDYDAQIRYNNFKRGIHIAFHPVSTTIERWQAELEITKANARNRQEQLLFGGTILNHPYGRYL